MHTDNDQMGAISVLATEQVAYNYLTYDGLVERSLTQRAGRREAHETSSATLVTEHVRQGCAPFTLCLRTSPFAAARTRDTRLRMAISGPCLRPLRWPHIGVRALSR